MGARYLGAVARSCSLRSCVASSTKGVYGKDDLGLRGLLMTYWIRMGGLISNGMSCLGPPMAMWNDPKSFSTAKLDTPVVPQLQCTNHVCPIRVHWHVKTNYEEHWRVKITITNFKYQMNNTQWTLVVRHPNLKNVTDVYRFVYKPLTLYESINDTGMFHGIKYYNDLLPEAGPHVAFDSLDPTGNITIKWDVMSWTPDGYVAVVTMTNFQMYRHIMSPGWTLGWTWSKKEVIWGMVGAQATEQGDCSKFKGNIPHCCKRNPTVVDLLPGVPFNQQIANCCKGGVVASQGQDTSAAVSSFQVSVGLSGSSNRTVRLPKNFTLLGPGKGYTCSQAKPVPPTVFISPDGRRKTQAMMTWNVTCTYSQILASQHPTCCVSLSSFYNSVITPCPACSCGCQNNNSCVASGSETIRSVVGTNRSTLNNAPSIQCTQHMCPIRVHWHVKLNYKEYWRVKISVTNFNYQVNYTQWTLVVQHPNLNNVTQVFSFAYKPLVPYRSTNDSGMFYGLKFFNDVLMEAGPSGNIQSELILEKDIDTFTFKEGWAFPRNIYFNGDECKMPLPEDYPFLPNSAHSNQIASLTLAAFLLLTLLAFW
ncbi:hypothetical protein LWI29_012566 [Acer saccharum]|uniref:COBRA C-terminal domain-containing protein n=1 Tax=Acer saccharum TaxID=4024 RepID=A0AA39S9P1_ACESA|nr:hypothetical protein LWI29_012566 [Acer saccharum]